MPKVMELLKRDGAGRMRAVGSIEIRNETGTEADLCFFGDIFSESLGEWRQYYPEGKAPQDVKEFLDQLDGVSRINVHINSGGGSVFGGIAIYNILKRHAAEVVVYVEGLAASIASVIAMAGDRIIIPANAQMMIHKPSSIALGNADEMRKMADILDGSQKVILNTYMQHAREGVTPEQINALIDAETWKNGEEWQEFFDIEVGERVDAAACASEYFGGYANLPEGLAGKDAETGGADIDAMAAAIAGEVVERLGRAAAEIATREKAAAAEKEKRIEAILGDLDLI